MILLRPLSENHAKNKNLFGITSTAEKQTMLEAVTRKYTSPCRDVIRAKIVLYAARGLANDEIARRLDTPRQIVSKWRKRFFEERGAGIEQRARRGRPPRCSFQRVVKIKTLACALPTSIVCCFPA